MDCPTAFPNDIHENYLLDRLSEIERADYEAHLQNCQSCQKILEAQRLLIAGIRQAGKQEMKDEIRRQVNQARSNKTASDWQLIYKAAAVVLILMISIGGFYYFQQSQSLPVTMSVKEQLPAVLEKAPADAEDEAMPSATAVLKNRNTDAPQESGDKPAPIAASRENRTTTNRQQEEPLEITEDNRSETLESLTSSGVSTANGASGKTSLSRGSAGQPAASEALASAGVAEADTETGITSLSADTIQPRAPALALKKQVQPDSTIAQIESLIKRGDFEKTSSRLEIENQPAEEKRLVENTVIEIYRYIAPAAVQSSNKNSPRQESITPNSTTFTTRSRIKTQPILLKFSFGEKSIHVNLKQESRQIEFGDVSTLPDFFPVEILSRDSLTIEMKWDVSLRRLKSSREAITLSLIPDRLLKIELQNGSVYKIDLSEDQTEAVLQK